MEGGSMNGEERIETAKVRAGDLIALIDTLGTAVDAEDIERAALVPLSPEAVQAVFTLGCLALMNLDTLTAILAGCCSEERIAMFARLGPMMSVPKVPVRRPRRPRPTAAERRAQAATAWLAGPAWEIVDGPEPEPGPDGECP